MTVQRRCATARPSPDPALERVQRELELWAALEAARTLQARLELLGGHDNAVRFVRRLRDDLATHLSALRPDDPRSWVPGEERADVGVPAEATITVHLGPAE